MHIDTIVKCPEILYNKKTMGRRKATIIEYNLYAGLTKEEYQSLIPDIQEENRKNLSRYAIVGGVVFVILIAANILVGGFASVNQPIYILALAVMIGLYFVVKYLAPVRRGLILPMEYLFAFTLYAFAITISLLHADRPGVTVIVMLLVIPMLFTGSPVKHGISTLLAAGCFSFLSFRLKTPDAVETDLWNAFTFVIVALMVNVFLNETKLKSLLRARRVAYLSETDLLTGVKNRNSYEERLSLEQNIKGKSLTCIYADVNGLHNLNNTQGHEAGDRMLKVVARELKECFGADNTYRIGGDEFVAFRPGADTEKTERDLDKMREIFAANKYHVSFGVAATGGELEEIDRLVRLAEYKMYESKREYYSEKERDRRNP